MVIASFAFVMAGVSIADESDAGPDLGLRFNGTLLFPSTRGFNLFLVRDRLELPMKSRSLARATGPDKRRAQPRLEH